MLHIFRAPDSSGSLAEWGETLNAETSLPQFTQFSHSADTISGSMLILQNAFSGLLLVFFACLVGRLNTWLGPNGEGLMDAFNPADHDLGVQIFGSLTAEEAEAFITARTPIVDRYLLGIPNASVGGTDYTVNVLDQPERFHILRGQTCMEADEIVLTELLAADLGVDIGDTVTVSVGGNAGAYKISGIYQCANDMGANLGLSRAGYGANYGASTTSWRLPNKKRRLWRNWRPSMAATFTSMRTPGPASMGSWALCGRCWW